MHRAAASLLCKCRLNGVKRVIVWRIDNHPENVTRATERKPQNDGRGACTRLRQMPSGGAIRGMEEQSWLWLKWRRAVEGWKCEKKIWNGRDVVKHLSVPPITTIRNAPLPLSSRYEYFQFCMYRIRIII